MNSYIYTLALHHCKDDVSRINLRLNAIRTRTTSFFSRTLVRTLCTPSYQPVLKRFIQVDAIEILKFNQQEFNFMISSNELLLFVYSLSVTLVRSGK